ncbi:MAG: 3-keto-5-aminohexanoate cleavage protein, partial [Streptosporangiaceae bacterium]
AEAVHLHARDAAGGESLAAADIGPAVAAVRAACPGTGVGVSTGLWVTGGDPRARRAAVAGWAGLDDAARPDFASVNVSETGWTQLIAALHGAGIEVEAGVWSVADARALAAFRPGDRLARVLVEISGGTAETAIDRADQVLAELDRTGAPEPVLLHGDEDACWPLVGHAGALGLTSRIGLEDTLTGRTARRSPATPSWSGSAWPPGARPCPGRRLAERTLQETRVPAGGISRKRQKARSIKATDRSEGSPARLAVSSAKFV